MKVLIRVHLRIVIYNPRRTYYPLILNQYTFNATKGSAQFVIIPEEEKKISVVPTFPIFAPNFLGVFLIG